MISPLGTTLAAQAWCSRLSRKRFSALGATDRAIAVVDRFAPCFHASHKGLIEHEVVTLVGQRVFGLALGYEDLNDHDELVFRR